MRVRRCCAVVAAICAFAAAAVVPARGDVSDADVQAARDRLIAAQKDATTATERLQRANAVAETARAGLARTEQEVNDIRTRLDALEAVVRVRAVEAYKNASSGSLSAVGLLFAGSDGGDSGRPARAQVYVRAVMSADSESLAQMGALRDDLEAKRRSQAQDSSRLAKARDEAAAAKARLDEALRTAEAEKSKLEQQKASEDAARAAAAAQALEEAAALARADRGGGASGGGGGGGSVPGGGNGLACPVQGPVSFTDSWGAARSGGRSHKGVDMMAAEGTPEAAIVSGTVARTSDVERGLGGITIWLQGDNGVSYYYAHNSRNVVHAGERVSQGQIVGYVGRTGNARSTAAHLHFEVHPGGGGAINPYPTAASAC